MWFVVMALQLTGKHWEPFSPKLHASPPSRANLLHYKRPPDLEDPQLREHILHKKLSEIPVFALSSERELQRKLRSHCRDGKLMMSSLERNPEDLLALRRHLESYPNELLVTNDSFGLVVDTGASRSVSYDLKDFVDQSITPINDVSMKGIASNLPVKGVGTIEWIVFDDSGQKRTIRTEGYYIPELQARLFSPQYYLREKQGVRSERE